MQLLMQLELLVNELFEIKIYFAIWRIKLNQYFNRGISLVK